ncbi:vitamin K epoxide reductase family protein [Pedobacter sp. Hv1]|uniref:vitamin K epoxide reductase family protein n=1 Tax=Pedobacter sp. Hv1 TaxID=1740090 RepID=UPI0006D8C9E8|nr:vitamin K epoxide reductase family protein [Pedobacter sp. Hv1]KQB98627.1 hypothetical protein AQF98_21545 [Pedobacter sp. Hv1]
MKFKLLDTYEHDKIHNVLSFTLNSFGLQYTDYQLKESIQSHLDTPSFATIKDILFTYGIQSTVMRKGNHAYEDFQTPFICLIKKNNWSENNFSIVTKVENDIVEFLEPYENRIVALKLAEFEKIDEKFILLMDDEEKKDEQEYKLNKKKEIQNRLTILSPFIITLAIIIYNLVFRNDYAEENVIQKTIYLFTFYFGLLVAALLIGQEVDSHNPFFKKLCGGESEKTTDCDAVLSSNGAKFIGVSWSIWGFSYFFTLFVAHLLLFNQLSTMLCAVASLAVFPYIFYSIYYQLKVVKKWCRLCLVTQFTLATNFLLGLLLSYNFANTLDWEVVGTIVLLGTLIVFLSSYMVSNLKKAKKGSLAEKKWKKLRYDELVFKTLLQQQPRLAVNNLGILVGNPDADIEIIKVCNLYCGPCALAHQELTKLMDTENRIKLRIIFNPNGQPNDRNTHLVFYFLGIEEQYGTKVFHEALEEWFGSATKDYKELTLKYPLVRELTNYLPKARMMGEWCNQMNINRTPTFFVNGYPLPEEYSFTDFKYLF